MPTQEEDVTTVQAAFATVDVSDEGEAVRFVLAFRALEATRPQAPPAPDSQVAPRFGGTFEVPLPADLDARMRVAFKAALEAPAPPPPET